MARCPFAEWEPLPGSGAYSTGPFKIVHHTTEGSTAEGAISTFRINRSAPHFTVDATTIYQHIDTEQGARALVNKAGGVETNRASAIQIELVGFAGAPKDPRALTLVARLCRWIEAEHGVPRKWPAGPPRPARGGRDPGGHNRDAALWNREGGHYGHCHVPENIHWDPAYTAEEAAFVLSATFDAQGRPAGGAPAAAPRARAARGGGGDSAPASAMLDHAVVTRNAAAAYVHDLQLPHAQPLPSRPRRAARAAAPAGRRRAEPPQPVYEAKVNVGSLLSFVDGVKEQEKSDVLYSVQLAQRGASGAYDRFTQTQSWYQKYVEILENLGWAVEQLAFTRFDQREGEFRMDQAALAVITAIATQNQLAVLQQSVAALAKLAEDDGTIRLFDFHSSLEGSGNFQIGAVQRSENGALSMALGAFYFHSTDERRRFLFFRWGAQQVHFWSAAQRMTLNSDFYARRRDDVAAKLDADFPAFIGDLKLDTRSR